MKLGKGVPSVWPGYVAAIASLVLSLLLLLAILVFAMAQVENMVAKYAGQIMRSALQEELQASSSPAATHGRGAGQGDSLEARASIPQKALPQPAHPTSATVTTRDIRLVFEAGVFELTPADTLEVIDAMRRAHKPADTRWEISSEVLDTDAVSERATYRLMANLRRNLIVQGVDQNLLEMRLKKSAQAPQGRDRGEVIVYLVPIKPANTGESQ